MITIRKILFAVAVAVGVGGYASPASAQYLAGPGAHKYSTLGGFLTKSQGNKQLPTFQAAPWYLYWPYDGHFLTPAPVQGAFYGPPGMGNFPVNPYFPGPGFGGYGPMPGGPAPYGYGPPAPGGFPAPGGALPAGIR